MEQGTEQWVKWRQGGIGASEIAAIMGLCPYNTPYDIWLVKTGRSRGFEGNSFTEHGKALEAKGRARYELTNMEDMPPACATHPKYPICIASLDGLRSDNKLILEIKCPKGRQTIDAALAGNVPEHYLAQVQYQLAVTGADMLHFFVYHEESQTDALVEVTPDIQYQGKLVAAALDFWNQYVLTDIAPPLTEQDAKLVDDPQVKAICDELLALKDKTDKASKSQANELKSKVLILGGHNKVRCGPVLVSKSVTKKGEESFRLTVSKREGA